MTDEKEKRLQAFISSGKAFEPGFFQTLAAEDKEDFMSLLTINFLFSQSSKFRGNAIDIAIMLEAMLVEFLGKYFCKEDKKKNTLLKSVILDRQNFSSKITWIKKILKIEHTEIYKKYESDLKEISRLIDFRNNLAHSILDSGEEFLNEIKKNPLPERIRITYYKDDDMKTEVLTREDIENFYTDCYKSMTKMAALEKELGLE
jgi:hypothetical protein